MGNYYIGKTEIIKNFGQNNYPTKGNSCALYSIDNNTTSLIGYGIVDYVHNFIDDYMYCTTINGVKYEFNFEGNEKDNNYVVKQVEIVYSSSRQTRIAIGQTDILAITELQPVDNIAIAAMQAIIRNYGNTIFTNDKIVAITTQAYLFADAMLFNASNHIRATNTEETTS